jgi:hypothetical protein
MMKYTRILRIFGAALILSLLMAAIPVVPVLAYDYTISLSPTQGKIGDTIHINGSSFTPSNDTSEKHARIIFSSQQVITGKYLDTDVNTYKVVGDAIIGYTGDTDEGEFGTTSTVTFTVPSSLTDGSITANVAPGTYYIYVTLTGATLIKSVATFTVTPGATLDPLSPATGPAGTQVQITGSNFPANATLVIKYDNTVIPITSGDTVTKSSGILITTITIPSSSTTGAHTISITAGTSTTTATFNVTASAALDALVPTTGSAGTAVTVSGSGFTASTAIVFKFDTIIITPTSGDSMTRSSGLFISSITVPTGSAAGAHTITVTAGTSTASATFTITGTVSATLSPLSPTSGLAGTNVTVSGSNFPASTALVFTFDTAALIPTGSTQTDSGGSFTSIIAVPSSAIAGAHTITVTAGSTTTTAAFTVTATTTTPPPPPPSTTAISLNQSGNTIGSLIGIGGTGFKHNSKVTVTYDDNEVATGNTDTNGFFVITFQVPPSKHGDHTITASDGTNTNKATFTVESTPPKIPQPIKPEMGVKVKAPVTFDWEDVTDNSSPVTYDLQVASASDFAGSSLILDKKDIAKSEYTLTDDEELKLAGQTDRLFWRIKAVDAALNESEWTGAGDFSISQPFKFTGWPLYLSIGVGAVLIFLFGFWMGRRTAFYY